MLLPEPSIDFEFRSGTEIKLGLERYFASPEAAVLCMAYDMADGLGADLWVPADGPLAIQPLLDHVARGGRIRGWNPVFEWYVWNLFCVPLYGWPPLQLSQLVDTMAEAAAMNMPQALDRCGKAMRLPEDKRKDKRGKELIKLLCCPQEEPVVRAPETYRRPADYKTAVTRHRKWLERGGRWINDPVLLQELYDYCLQDVVAEVTIARKLRRLSPYEQNVWIGTQEMNLDGVPVAIDEIPKLVGLIDRETRRLNAELAEVTAGAIASGAETAALRAWINERHPLVVVTLLDLSDPDEFKYREVEQELLPNMEAETLERALVEHGDAMSAPVRRAIEIRLCVSQTSAKKLVAMESRVADDGTLKHMYAYHGASTGRDASRGGVNLQNMASPTLSSREIAQAFIDFVENDPEFAYQLWGDKTMEAIVSCCRGVIKAPKGFVFFDADYSSIENRVSAWLSGQDDVLELFREGLDEYRAFAALIFDKKPEDITPAERKFAKPGVLGGMFGQGWRGLIDYAAGMGVKLTPEQSQRITKLYRTRYDHVETAWYRFGDVAMRAVLNPGQWYDVGRAAGERQWNGRELPSIPFGRVSLMSAKGYLWMRLPSSRLIAWAQPKIERKRTPWGSMRDTITVEQETAAKQWRRDKLLGASIFQSAVQAIARDILIAGWLRVKAAGYRVVMRTHDELTALVPEGFGSIDEFGRLMCINPEWAPDLPIKFEGWVDVRFRK